MQNKCQIINYITKEFSKYENMRYGMKDNLTGERIKKLRTAKHWTQKELEEKTGISHITISRYENGHQPPDAYQLRKLAAALGCETGYLDGSLDEASRETTDIKAEIPFRAETIDLLREIKQYSDASMHGRFAAELVDNLVYQLLDRLIYQLLHNEKFPASHGNEIIAEAHMLGQAYYKQGSCKTLEDVINNENAIAAYKMSIGQKLSDIVSDYLMETVARECDAEEVNHGKE